MKKKRTVGCLASVVLLGIVAICLLAGIVWVGIQEYKDLPRQVSGFDFGEYAIDEWAYSADQIYAISELGYPQSFSILFYHEEDQDGNQAHIRYEEWLYPNLGLSLTYENGVWIADDEIPTWSAVPTQYRPSEFISFMNREQLAHTTGIDSWLILPVENELMVNAELYYAEGITFGFQNENLLFIEALGLEDPDDSGDIVTVAEEPLTNSARTTPLTSSGDSQIDNALLLMFSSHMRINAEVESAQINVAHLAAPSYQTGSGNEIDALIQLYSSMIANLRASDDYDPDLEARLVGELEEKVLALQQQAQELETRRRRGRGGLLGRLAKGTGRFLGRVVGGLMDGAAEVGIFAIEDVAPKVLKEAIQGGVPLNAALVRRVTRELLIDRVGTAIYNHQFRRAERLAKVEPTLDPVTQATDDAEFLIGTIEDDSDEDYDATQESSTGGDINSGSDIVVYDFTQSDTINFNHRVGELDWSEYWKTQCTSFSVRTIEPDIGAVHLEFDRSAMTVSGWVEASGQNSEVSSLYGWDVFNISGSLQVTFEDLPLVPVDNDGYAAQYSGIGNGIATIDGMVRCMTPDADGGYDDDNFYSVSGQGTNSNPVPVLITLYTPGYTSGGQEVTFSVSSNGIEPSNGFKYRFGFSFNQPLDVPLP